MQHTPPPPLSSGSRWLRWEPHVHAPGTLFNDQFKGNWDEYLTTLENATPATGDPHTDHYGLLSTRYISRRNRAKIKGAIARLRSNFSKY